MRGLAIILVIWAAVAVVWVATVGEELADAQQAEPKTSLLDTACTTAYQVAVLGHVNAEKCRLVVQHDEGQTALITVKVKITGQGWYTVSLAYQKTVWSQSAISIAPAS